MKRIFHLLPGCLLVTAALAEEKWVDLFDGRSLQGWESQAKANWRVEGGAIAVDDGEKGLLVTTRKWTDYELEVDFLAAEGADSGVLLSTKKTVTDPATECYEVNIAPQSSPFPTGSLVGRFKVAGIEESPDWRSFRARVESGVVTIWLDGKKLVEYKDRKPLAGGFIGLQFSEGKVLFRNIRLKNLGL